jgi:hypothetical protein
MPRYEDVPVDELDEWIRKVIWPKIERAVLGGL